MANVSINPFGTNGGFDNSQSRFVLNGNVAFTGNYVTGGLLPNWTNMTDTSGLPVVLSATPSSAALPTAVPILVTQFGVSSNVATLLAPNSLKAGQSVQFWNMTGNAAVLNGGNIFTPTGVSNIAFNVPITTSNYANATVSGVASLVIGPDQLYVESISGSGLTYGYNKQNATIQVFQGNVELANGSNLAIADTVQFAAEWVRN